MRRHRHAGLARLLCVVVVVHADREVLLRVGDRRFEVDRSERMADRAIAQGLGHAAAARDTEREQLAQGRRRGGVELVDVDDLL